MKRPDAWLNIGEFLLHTGHMTTKERGELLLGLMYATKTGSFYAAKTEALPDKHPFFRKFRPPIRRDLGIPMSQWRRLRDMVLERDGWACRYCGVSGVPLHCDHIIPVARGGSNDLDNLTAACQTCNSRKGTKLNYTHGGAA